MRTNVNETIEFQKELSDKFPDFDFSFMTEIPDIEENFQGIIDLLYRVNPIETEKSQNAMAFGMIMGFALAIKKSKEKYNETK